jgi:hypothetical protein
VTNSVAHPPSSRERLVIGGAVALGLLLVGASWLVHGLQIPGTSWPDWVESLLLNLGSAVLLVAPIEIFSTRIRRQIDDVRSEVRGLAGLDERVSVAITADRAALQGVFDGVVTAAPSLRTVRRALRTAANEGLLDAGVGLRVRVHPAAGTRLRLRLVRRTLWLGGAVHFTLENLYGEPIATWTERQARSLEHLFKKIAHAARNTDVPLVPVPSDTLRHLSESLLYALKYPIARPMIEFFEPQWALTTHSIASGQEDYEVVHNRPDRISMYRHVLEKEWIDRDSYNAAYDTADYFYPRHGRDA